MATGNQSKESMTLITHGLHKAEGHSPTAKRCTRCGEFKASEAYYSFLRSDGRIKLRSMCKTCYITGQRIYYEKNKEYYQKKGKEWYAKNADKVAGYRKRFLEKHPGYMDRYNKAYREKNRLGV